MDNRGTGFKAFPWRGGHRDATITVMGDCDAAQAAELVRALREQLRDMTTQLARVEHQLLQITLWSRAARAQRLEAAALHRDIAEAQMHIDRLYRRYLNGAERTRVGV